MKKMFMLFVTVFTVNSGANELDIAHRYQDVLELIKVEKNLERAKHELEELMKEVSSEDILSRDIYNTYYEINGVEKENLLDKAIKFVTGKKDSYYCKGVGLVYLKGTHNDGTISELFLKGGKRILEYNSYSIVTEGSWTYQLATGYRDPISSYTWVNDGTKNSYNVEELRKTKNGKDVGKFSAKWEDRSMSNSFRTSGNVKEPVPMFMAIDFHNWGERDLGYKINFKIGSTEKIKSTEKTFRNGRILLISDRTVIKKHNQFRIKDFDGKFNTYYDCYQVETKIVFNGIKVK